MDEKIDLFERLVKLPTDSQWVNVPDSPFQVMTHLTDIVGIFYVRVRPAYAAYWTEFMSGREAGVEHPIGDHWAECARPQCPGCA